MQSAVENKKPVVLPRRIYEKLDPYHRTLAEVLSEKGRCVITDGQEGQYD